MNKLQLLDLFSKLKAKYSSNNFELLALESKYFGDFETVIIEKKSAAKTDISMSSRNRNWKILKRQKIPAWQDLMNLTS